MPPSDILDPAQIRQDFPILQQKVHGNRELVYFDNGASTQHPRAVLEAMDSFYRTSYANVHRGSHELSLRASDEYDRARQVVQGFLHAADSSEIIFTSGATAAINLVAHSLGDITVGEGDEILITEMEHHSNIVPWQQLAERKKAHLRWIPLTPDGLLDLADLELLLNRRTKIVALTSISNVLGTLNPVRELTSRAHEVGAKVLVDAAQSVPHQVTDVQELDADFLVFSGHKLLGPTGVGVLYGKRELLETMPPFLGGGSMIHTVTREGFTQGELPARFEAGTPPIVPAIGLAAAIEYLEPIGLDNIFRHECELASTLMDCLADHPSVRVLGPPADQRAGIVSFVIEGVNSLDFATMIDLKGVAIRNGHHCAMPLHERYGLSESNRASFYLYNTVDEVHYFSEVLGKTIHLLKQ
ncbi:MAG: SufS family cysteine desulfurase [Planctomycetota bacterium]|nr:SufS family cysteine desulfurase [Planctomycetota bacterium]